jgi:hypothetical protein
MAADLVEHVVEERHAGVGLAAARAIEVEPNPHIGFARNAVNLTDAHRPRLRETNLWAQCAAHIPVMQ